MNAKNLTDFLEFSVKNGFPVLITGKPGIGKSDIVFQVSQKTGFKLIISHPVVSDPTDFKGLPFAVDGKAKFLPFGELDELINTNEPTIYFLDDLGQAPASVQAACMQLILARRINGHKVSDFVTFIAATNRREDHAGVMGILEPVKSRFASIVQLDFEIDSWVSWALKNNMPTELISFAQFRPELIDNFKPSKDMVNSPCPRTVAYVGKMQNANLPQNLFFEAVKGAAGEAFAVEYQAFLKVYMNLPSVTQIIMDPINTIVPAEISGKFALMGALAEKLTPTTISPILQYLEKFPLEITTACIKNATVKNPAICATREFIQWASDKTNLFV